MFAFGFGTRKCLGQHFAETSIKTLVVHLVAQYELSVSQSQINEAKHKVGSSNWIPLADVKLNLAKLK